MQLLQLVQTQNLQMAKIFASYSRYSNIYIVILSYTCIGLSKGIGKRFYMALYICVIAIYISVKISVNFLLLLYGYILMGHYVNCTNAYSLVYVCMHHEFQGLSERKL